MRRRDGIAPGSGAIKESFRPAWNAATYRGNYRCEMCGTNAINLTDGKGKNIVKMATFNGRQSQQRTRGAKGGGPEELGEDLRNHQRT